MTGTQQILAPLSTTSLTEIFFWQQTMFETMVVKQCDHFNTITIWLVYRNFKTNLLHRAMQKSRCFQHHLRPDTNIPQHLLVGSFQLQETQLHHLVYWLSTFHHSVPQLTLQCHLNSCSTLYLSLPLHSVNGNAACILETPFHHMGHTHHTACPEILVEQQHIPVLMTCPLRHLQIAMVNPYHYPVISVHISVHHHWSLVCEIERTMVFAAMSHHFQGGDADGDCGGDEVKCELATIPLHHPSPHHIGAQGNPWEGRMSVSVQYRPYLLPVHHFGWHENQLLPSPQNRKPSRVVPGFQPVNQDRFISNISQLPLSHGFLHPKCTVVFIHMILSTLINKYN